MSERTVKAKSRTARSSAGKKTAGKAASSRASARRMRRNEKIGFVVIVMIIMVLAGALSVVNTNLRTKDAQYASEEAVLQSQIADEQERTDELTEKKTYVQTKKYIEEIAREKLNLVYPDEIIFKEDSQ